MKKRNLIQRKVRTEIARNKLMLKNVRAVSARTGISERTLYNILFKSSRLPEIATLDMLERFL